MQSPLVVDPIFQRAMCIVTNISNTSPAIVTTAIPHNYINGMNVRLKIPAGFGMPEISGKIFPIIVINSTQFSVPVDATSFQYFNNQVFVGTTDGLGNISNIQFSVAPARFARGQFFIFNGANELQYAIITSTNTDLSGNMYFNGEGSGTFRQYLDAITQLEKAIFTITGALPNVDVYFSTVPYPKGLQTAQVVPAGETDSALLKAATYNVLGEDFYS